MSANSGPPRPYRTNARYTSRSVLEHEVARHGLRHFGRPLPLAKRTPCHESRPGAAVESAKRTTIGPAGQGAPKLCAAWSMPVPSLAGRWRFPLHLARPSWSVRKGEMLQASLLGRELPGPECKKRVGSSFGTSLAAGESLAASRCMLKAIAPRTNVMDGRGDSTGSLSLEWVLGRAT